MERQIPWIFRTVCIDQIAILTTPMSESNVYKKSPKRKATEEEGPKNKAVKAKPGTSEQLQDTVTVKEDKSDSSLETKKVGSNNQTREKPGWMTCTRRWRMFTRRTFRAQKLLACTKKHSEEDGVLNVFAIVLARQTDD